MVKNQLLSITCSILEPLVVGLFSEHHMTPLYQYLMKTQIKHGITAL